MGFDETSETDLAIWAQREHFLDLFLSKQHICISILMFIP